MELGSTMEVVQTGAKRIMRECKDTFLYIPLLEGLQALLKSQEILDEVLHIWCHTWGGGGGGTL